MKYIQDHPELVGYVIILVLLLILIFSSPKVKCLCTTSAKYARAPWHALENPANMNNVEVTQSQQNLMNIQGCAQQGGVWEPRGDNSGVCNIYGIRPGISHFS